MTVEKLGWKCGEIGNDCNRCEYQKECSGIDELLDGISPFQLLTILQTELDQTLVEVENGKI